MSFGEAISTVLGKYADFNGRARRSEYWWWALAFGLGYFVVLILFFALKGFGVVLLLLYVLGLFVPNLAVGVRRMHDIGKSGWFLLMGLIPFVGGIILLIFACQDSQPDNQYGPSPKYSGGGYGGYGGPPQQFGQPQYGQPQYGAPPPQAQWGAQPPQPQYGAPPPPPFMPPPDVPPAAPPPPPPYQP